MRFEDLFPLEEPARGEPEPPVWHARPDWLGAPPGELGRVVPLAVVVGRSDRGVVAVSHAVAHSTGVLFDLAAYVGGLTPRATQAVFQDQHAGRHGDEELPDGFLRLGVELPGGDRVSNIGSNLRHHLPGSERPSGPLLIPGGGGGGQTGRSSVSWNGSYWLWPLPAAGVLRIMCEWPIAGIPVSTVEVGTPEILVASAQATRIFDEDEAGPSVATASHQYVVAQAARAGSGADAGEEDGGLNDVAAELRRAQRSLAQALAALERLRQ